MAELLKKIDTYCRPIPLLAILLGLVLLRLPNFFEPYWYGDEGIYLAVGNGLRQGKLLYAEIIDHKTPIIYYLAMTPNQQLFRLLLLAWMVATTILFFHLTKHFMQRLESRVAASLGFMLLTTLPWFEGHIANGELFVMGFTFAGGFLLLHTPVFKTFLDKQKLVKKLKIGRREVSWLLASGVLFGLGVLTKVPAVLDFTAFATMFWLLLAWVLLNKSSRAKFGQALMWLSARAALVVAGLAVPIVVSIVYYWLRGSGADYASFGLLYNFRYAQHWDPGVTSPLMIFYTTLLGKVVVTGAAILAVTGLLRWLGVKSAFLIGWVFWAMMAATLSNRPYPHYFLQVIPPLALLAGVVIDNLLSGVKTRESAISVGAGVLSIGFFIFLLIQYSVGLYETGWYYQQFWKLTTGQISYQEYRNDFNHLMEDNYAAAPIIGKTAEPEIFIWGTNPMLYALTGKSPTGRFTVSFHIKDFAAHQETMDDLQATQPKFIVVMNDETEELPGLNSYLQQNYLPHTNFSKFVLWMRITP